jgi:hypothetical protein
MALFTLDGERRWADSWDPNYPKPGRREHPGTVFTTSNGVTKRPRSGRTTAPSASQRARHTRHDRRTIAIDGVGSRKDATHVRVPYDLTAVTPTADGSLEAFNVDYETEIAAWSTEIAAAIGRRRRVGQDPVEGR